MTRRTRKHLVGKQYGCLNKMPDPVLVTPKREIVEDNGAINKAQRELFSRSLKLAQEPGGRC